MHCSSVNGFENCSYVLVVANVCKIGGGGIIYSTHCGQNGKGTVSETKYSTPHCLATSTATANTADDFSDAVDVDDDALHTSLVCIEFGLLLLILLLLIMMMIIWMILIMLMTI